VKAKVAGGVLEWLRRHRPVTVPALAGADPSVLEFVTLDDQQAQAAERKGLHVLGPH